MENVDLRNENQANEELLDLIRQKNPALQEESVSMNAFIEILFV